MKVNTISCASYNFNQRKNLEKILVSAEKKFNMILDSALDDEKDDELFNLELEQAKEEKFQAWLDCFAAQFHKCRNDWFLKVINNFERGKYHQISEKQFRCFSKYAFDKDDNFWKTGETYCRCGDALITLKQKTIKIDTIRC